MGETTGLDFATLAIAAGGFALAVVSIGWQAATYFLSGPRVKVMLGFGFVRADGMLMRGPASDPRKLERMAASQRFTIPVLTVQVTNVGRMPASITSIDARLEDGITLEIPTPGNEPLPYRLDAHSSQGWHMEAGPVVLAVAASLASDVSKKPRQKVRMGVTLAHGRTLVTKQSVVIPW